MMNGSMRRLATPLLCLLALALVLAPAACFDDDEPPPAPTPTNTVVPTATATTPPAGPTSTVPPAGPTSTAPPAVPTATNTAPPAFPTATATFLPTPCVEFEDVPLMAMFNVGDSFPSAGTVINMHDFQWTGGAWTGTGNAQIQAGDFAGGSGQEVAVSNINLEFIFGHPVPGLGFNFGEYGGNLNIEINGDFRNFQNFVDIDGLNIGGVTVAVVNGLGNDKGHVQLTGVINDFVIGGQELFLDDVCP